MAARDEVYIDIIAETKKAIKSMAGLTAAIYAAVKATKLIIKNMKTTAEFKQAEMAFKSIARQAGVMSDDIIESMQKMSGETISQLDIMASANRAAILGIPMDELDRLMKIARSSATAFGTDTSKMFNDLVIGIGRGSRMILDNLGIVVEAEKVYGDFAKSIGKTATELSETERRQAFLNAVLEEGERIMKQVGEAGQGMTPMEPMQQFQAAIDDMKVALSEGLLPIINEVFTTLARGIREFTSWMQQAKNWGDALMGETDDYLSALKAEELALTIVMDIEKEIAEERARKRPREKKLVGLMGDLADAELYLKYMQEQRETLEENKRLEEERLKATRDAIKFEEGRVGLLKEEKALADSILANYMKTPEGLREALEAEIDIQNALLLNTNLTGEQLIQILYYIGYLREQLKVEKDITEEKRKQLLPQAGTPPIAGAAGGGAQMLLGRLPAALREAKIEAVDLGATLQDALINTGLQAVYDFSAAFIGETENIGESLKNALKSAIVAGLMAWGSAMMSIGNIPGAIAAYAGAGAVSAMAGGGMINEPVYGVGKSGQRYLFGEAGPERVSPIGKGGGGNVYITVEGSVLAERELEGIALQGMKRLSRGY